MILWSVLWIFVNNCCWFLSSSSSEQPTCLFRTWISTRVCHCSRLWFASLAWKGNLQSSSICFSSGDIIPRYCHHPSLPHSHQSWWFNCRPCSRTAAFCGRATVHSYWECKHGARTTPCSRNNSTLGSFSKCSGGSWGSSTAKTHPRSKTSNL